MIDLNQTAYLDQFLVVCGTAGVGFCTASLIIAPFFLDASLAVDDASARPMRLMAFVDVLALLVVGSLFTVLFATAALMGKFLGPAFPILLSSLKIITGVTFCSGAFCCAALSVLESREKWIAVSARMVFTCLPLGVFIQCLSAGAFTESRLATLLFSLVYLGVGAIFLVGWITVAVRKDTAVVKCRLSKGAALRKSLRTYLTFVCAGFVYQTVAFVALDYFIRQHVIEEIFAAAAIGWGLAVGYVWLLRRKVQQSQRIVTRLRIMKRLLEATEQ